MNVNVKVITQFERIVRLSFGHLSCPHLDLYGLTRVDCGGHSPYFPSPVPQVLLLW